jgi:ribosomal protein L17
MSKIHEHHKEQDELKKERMAAAIIAALVQHGIIPHTHPKQKFVKKESEWKKRRISGLR